MIQRVLKFVLADLARPWGLMTMLCAAGCAISLGFLEFISGNSRLTIGHEWLDFSAVCLLLASVIAGVIAITRTGTSMIAPIIVLGATLAIGWPYVVMGLIQVPYLLLSNLLGLPFSHPRIFFVFLVAVGIVLLFLRRK